MAGTKLKWKRELATRLSVPLSEILDRHEAAQVLGLHPKTLTNLAVALRPRFFKAPLGRNGYALYCREELEHYRLRPDEWAKAQRAVAAGPLPWPPEVIVNPVRWMLKHLGMDEDYIQAVLGNQPRKITPPTPTT